MRNSLVPVGGPQQAGRADVDELPQIEVQGRHSLWDLWCQGMRRERRPRLPPIRVDNALSAVELAAAGAGVTVICPSYAERPVAEGRLAALLGGGVPAPLVLGMSRNLHRRETAAVRDFMAWVSVCFPVVEGQAAHARKGGRLAGKNPHDALPGQVVVIHGQPVRPPT
ncbi:MULTISPECIES: LysR substrate-binding domain-containing protein [unclassified Paracoccus (in: a-proteobacteria)]|uniref:LysR substrate-binding domain-containing protein n=1 Tax=unclassified Paracoccus (in: a-proteobacteria) TaxID=2688777 RepID=UPI001F392AC0|nr:LysR substrate-binding domain-containing protein [Paracoccus sp. MC1862]